jgi:hypothetical protein
VANDWSNGEGWSHTDGDYAQLALATLAGIVELTGSQEAAEAYAMLVAEGAPFASDSDFSRDPIFAITPPGEETTPARPPESAPVVTDPDDGGQTGGGNSDGNTGGGSDSGGGTGSDHGNSGDTPAAPEVPSTDTPIGIPPEAKPPQVTPPEVTPPRDEVPSSSPSVPTDDVPSSSPTIPTDDAAQKLALSILLGGEAWEGNPLAAVSVDGREVFRGEVQGRGGETQVSLGDIDADASHVVQVSFLNDAWGGTEATDRNLWIGDIHLDGASLGAQARLDMNGDVAFRIDGEHQTLVDQWLIG